jgi:HEPN domain-containing protein
MASLLENDAKAWLDASRYDLDTAKALFESRRYLYVLFMCQQSAEKVLKACLTIRTQAFPPRIHSLVRLADLAQLDLSMDEKSLLERLDLYYIQSRYPPDVRVLAKSVTRGMALDLLERTQGLCRRMRRRLSLRKRSGKR